jgi:hypothetical protein
VAFGIEPVFFDAPATDGKNVELQAKAFLTAARNPPADLDIRRRQLAATSLR